MQEERRLKAQKALDKQAAYGEPVDFDRFHDESEEHPYLENLQELPEEKQKAMLLAGVDVTEKERAGTFIQEDHSVIHTSVLDDGVEVLSITEALEKYDWLEDYYWRAVAVDADRYTARTELRGRNGYFVRALPGVKAVYPVQACLYIGQEGLLQSVHNIIIAEEGSELHLITGCTTGHDVGSGMHIGVSEIFVKKNARLSFTMVHSWAEEVVVRPRTTTIVEEGGVFLSNYICMKPVQDIQMYPTTYLTGKNGLARYHSILVGQPHSRLDVGSRVVLQGEGSRAEIVARSLTKGGIIINRGHLVGEVVGVKGHLECRGLMLSKEGLIYAVPELEARVDGVDLSHEAAVGKIAEEEIEYLMARGLTEEEATATIVRGFLNVKIMGLPPDLEEEVQRAIEQSEQSYL
ncbi:MAG TPA: SufD family Fe-S cluster assembly protein [Syntrophomonadaceae bacterium]|nr:SufD family Fe-S cluster assembly protein [Syntrophomonadaceae bacterium]